MEKCLKTVLGASADNDNLPYFGRSIIEFKGDASGLNVQLSGGRYTILSGTFYTTNGYSTEIPSSGELPENDVMRFYIKPGETGKIAINKYDIRQLANVGNAGSIAIDFSEYYKSSRLTKLLLQCSALNSDVKGSIEAFVENQCEYREYVEDEVVTLNVYLTLITFHGSAIGWSNANMTITFGENNVTIVNEGGTTIGTYNRTSKVWTY